MRHGTPTTRHSLGINKLTTNWVRCRQPIGLGRMYHRQGALPAAQECFEQAFSYFEAQQYDLAAADITIELGNLARARDDYDTAKSYYKQALERYNHDMSKAGQAVACLDRRYREKTGTTRGS